MCSPTIHWRDWCRSWNSNSLATWWKELTHLKRHWYWERLKAKGEGDDRRWDGWMASPTQQTWVWVNSGSWWWTERPGVLQSMGLQRIRQDWATELNWNTNWSWDLNTGLSLKPIPPSFHYYWLSLKVMIGFVHLAQKLLLMKHVPGTFYSFSMP